MTLLRLFTRAIFLLSLASIGLLTSILFVVGAFRPVRFFVAAGEIQRDQPVLLVSEAGQTLPITQRADTTLPFQNRIAWLNDMFDLTFWENGRTRQLGQLPANSAQSAAWSVGGLLAWKQTVDNQRHLMLWDGETSQDITPGSDSVDDFFWTSHNTLLWVETAADGRWWLRRWADDVVTDLTAPSNQRVTETQFFDCEGVVVHAGDSVQLYHHGQLTAIPASLAEFDEIHTGDCQTYLLTGVGSVRERYDVLWNGTEAEPLSFRGFGIRGEDEVIGIQTYNELGSRSRLTLVHQQGDTQQVHEMELSQPVNYPSLLFWEGSFSLWRISHFDSILLLLWNHDTDEVSQAVHHLDAGGRYIYGEAQERAAWFDSTRISTVNLTIWENQQLSQHTLKISETPVVIRDAKLQWMSDGTLMLGMVQDDLQVEGESLYTHVYRWDGQHLYPLTTLPTYAGPISDWMTWE